MEIMNLDEISISDDLFLDALDEFPSSDSEETLYSSDVSHLESVGDAPLEEVTTSLLRQSSPPPISLRRRRSSSKSTIPRRLPAADSKGSSGDLPVDSELETPRERRNKVLLALKDQAREREESSGSGLGSNQISTITDQNREISRSPSEIWSRETDEPEDLVGSPQSGLLVSVAGLVIKAIGFQISLLISSIKFPIWLLHCSFLLVTDPFQTLKRARDHVITMLVSACSILRDRVGPSVHERLSSRQGIGKWALRLAWGCLWSFFVCFMLFGCLVTAFLVGRLLMQYVVEEPIQTMEDLSFDYTKASPVALVPISSCNCVSRGLDCGKKVGVGKHGGGRLIPPNHKLQLTVSLVLPESDYNRKLGIFQIRTEFLSANGSVTASSSRPCMLQFKSSPVRFLGTFFKSGPLLAGYSSESQIISLKMTGFTEGTEPTVCIRVILEQRAEYRPGAGIPEIYTASLRLESELPLFKWIIWNWRKTVFIWISMVFFIFELLIILVCCTLIIIPRARPRDVSSSRI